jgi:hypothetical protein
MGLANFLFEGQAPPSTTTYGQRTDNIPQWMSDYTQGLIARANAVAAEPYQAYGGPRIAGFTPDSMNAFAQTRTAANAYTGPLQQALGMTQNALEPGQGGMAAAQPYMQQAGQAFPGAAQQYMDPYIQNVIGRSQELANRNFTENLMPQISDTFTRAGQYGSAGMQERALRGARDVSENLQSQANAQLSGAYQNAGQMFGADQGRIGALAQLAGQLGGQGQAAQLQGAQQLGQLGQLSQQLGLTGAGALDTVGQMQQGLQQRSLDTAYQDFQNQTNYPRQTIDWMSSVIRGLPTPTSTQSTQVGPASVYQPSPLAQLGSFATGIGGLGQLLGQGGGKARGGYVYG